MNAIKNAMLLNRLNALPMIPPNTTGHQDDLSIVLDMVFTSMSSVPYSKDKKDAVLFVVETMLNSNLITTTSLASLARSYALDVTMPWDAFRIVPSSSFASSNTWGGTDHKHETFSCK